jgi:large subunit ribosomal protein L24e
MTSVYTADRLDKHAFSAAISSQFHHEAHSLTTFAQQEVAKKRTRRTVKHQRAIVGASLDVIKERRGMRPEAREAARKAAIKEGKEKKTAAESKKKAEKAKSAANNARGNVGRIQSKQGAKGSAPKVKATTR